MKLILPFPPSVNTYWRHPSKGPLAGRHLISEAGRKYRETVQRLIRVASPMDARLAVLITAHMPDRRRRDLDNIPKSILDALTHAGLWLDDEQIDVLTIARADVIKGGQIILEVSPIHPQERNAA